MPPGQSARALLGAARRAMSRRRPGGARPSRRAAAHVAEGRAPPLRRRGPGVPDAPNAGVAGCGQPLRHGHACASAPAQARGRLRSRPKDVRHGPDYAHAGIGAQCCAERRQHGRTEAPRHRRTASDRQGHPLSAALCAMDAWRTPPPRYPKGPRQPRVWDSAPRTILVRGRAHGHWRNAAPGAATSACLPPPPRDHALPIGNLGAGRPNIRARLQANDHRPAGPEPGSGAWEAQCSPPTTPTSTFCACA